MAPDGSCSYSTRTTALNDFHRVSFTPQPLPLDLVSDPASPIIHLKLAGEPAAAFPDRGTQVAVLEATVQVSYGLGLG